MIEMIDETTRFLFDDEGKILQHKLGNGRWVDRFRIVTDEDGTETKFSIYKPKTDDYRKAFDSQDIAIAINDISDRLEYKGNTMSDAIEAIILNRLQDLGLSSDKRIRQAMLEIGHWNRYHPVKDYFNGSIWDGKNRLDELVSHFSFDDRTRASAYTFIKRWMLGCVAKVMLGGQNFMLVIDGPQGIGKSFFVRWLCPLPKYFIEGAIHPEDKDSYLRLMSYLIWEVGELEGVIRHKERAALKDFITRIDVTARPPYARYDITKPAMASLIGTINSDGAGFLNDPTGSRRFNIINCLGIDHNYTNIDKNQLWAQIVSMYRAGEPWQLTKAETEIRNKINGHYQNISVVEQLLVSHFELIPQSVDDFMPTIEILGELELRGLRGSQRALMMELSTLLKRAGLEVGRKGGKRGFFGVKRLANLL